MKSVDEVIDFILAARDEGERDDLTLGEQDERRLMHGEFIGERLGEISADELTGVDLRNVGIAFDLEAFGGGEFGERTEVILGLFETRIGGGAFGGDNDGGVDGFSDGVGWAFEDGEQDFTSGGGFLFRGLFLFCVLIDSGSGAP